jgi:RNA polymerase sigma-70 factor (ECF subfamily)
MWAEDGTRRRHAVPDTNGIVAGGVSVIDRELVLRARTGDLQAFSTLVDARMDRLYALACLVVGDDRAAEGAVRDALVRAWRDVPSLRDPDRFDPWLQQVLIRRCYRAATHPRADATDSVDDDPRAVSAVEPPPAPPTPAVLEQAFRALRPEQRAAVVVRHGLGLSLADSAVVLGVPIGTVQARASQALASLRTALGPAPATSAGPEATS